jgi:hypothetical protein
MIITLPSIPTFILMICKVSQGFRKCREVLESTLCIPLVVLSEIVVPAVVLPTLVSFCTVAVDQVDS